MACPRCGHDGFYARQVCYCDVVVADGGSVLEYLGAYDAAEPYGPFVCRQCGADYEQLPFGLRCGESRRSGLEGAG